MGDKNFEELDPLFTNGKQMGTAVAVDASNVGLLKQYFSEQKWDYDLLKESLGKTLKHLIMNIQLTHLTRIVGTISTQYYLESENYVPERLSKRIDEATSSMMESGLHQFFTSYAHFRDGLHLRAFNGQQDDDDHEQALTIEQLIRPMKLIFCLWGVALTIFTVEIVVFKWNQLRRRFSRRVFEIFNPFSM